MSKVKFKFYKLFYPHPEVEIEVTYIGIAEIIPGDDGDSDSVEPLELYIDRKPARIYPENFVMTKEWRELHADITNAVRDCDTPEIQAKISIPRPTRNPPSNAHEVPLTEIMVGEANGIGGGSMVTEYSKIELK